MTLMHQFDSKNKKTTNIRLKAAFSLKKPVWLNVYSRDKYEHTYTVITEKHKHKIQLSSDQT